MAMVEKSVLIERSAQQMFDLVDEVEDYPSFLPWCSQTRVEFRDASRTVATLQSPTSGSVRFDDIDVVAGSQRNQEGRAWRRSEVAERNGAGWTVGEAGRRSWRVVPGKVGRGLRGASPTT